MQDHTIKFIVEKGNIEVVRAKQREKGKKHYLKNKLERELQKQQNILCENIQAKADIIVGNLTNMINSLNNIVNETEVDLNDLSNISKDNLLKVLDTIISKTKNKLTKVINTLGVADSI